LLVRALGLVALATVALVLGLPGQASANTALPTTITSDQTWGASGNVYTGSSVTIASGVTVTVDPGVIVKLTGTLTVNGTLNAQGTAANPISFTSLKDDSLGGDTNGDGGASQPARGDWAGIALNTGSSVLDHATVLYAGAGSVGAVRVNGGVSPQITNSTIRFGKYFGINVSGGGSAEIANDAVSDNNSYGIYYSAGSSQTGQVRIHDNLVERNGGGYGIYVSIWGSSVQGQALGGNTLNQNSGQAINFNAGPSQAIPADITQNTLAGNAQNGIWVSGTATTATWNGAAPIVLNSTVTVPAGETLTLGAGQVIKSTTSGSLTVNGTLAAQGTGANPISFTSLKDDSIGGDTNGDGGATQPARGDWGGLYLTTGSSVLDHAAVLWAGAGYSDAVKITGASPQVTNSTVRWSKNTGISVSSGGSPEIANDTVSDNNYAGIYYSAGSSQSGQVKIHNNLIERNGTGGISVSLSTSAVQGQTLGGNTVNQNSGKGIYFSGYSNPAIPSDITQNTLAGNAQNGIWVAGKATTATWSGTAPIVLDSSVTVPSGETLALGAGQVIKSTTSGSLTVNGTLAAQGTGANPISFTSLKDDSIGGDTNGDGGATQPARGDWGGLYLTTGTSVLDHTAVLWAGAGTSDAVRISGASPQVTNSTVRWSKNGGINVSGAGSPQITGSTIRNNSGGGIHMFGGGAPEVAGNTISDNGNTGVYYGMPNDSVGQIKIHDNTIERNAAGGIVITALTAYMHLSGVTLGGNTVNNNAGQGIVYDGYTIDFTYQNQYQPVSIPPDIDENDLSGNGRNGIWISGQVDQSTTWANRGYAFVLNSDGVTVGTGATLTLSPGMTVKANWNGMGIGGTLIAEGTQAQPITFTSVSDDSVAGDTNGDGGATQPLPGDLTTLSFAANAGTITGGSRFDFVRVAYAGTRVYPYTPALNVKCPCPHPPRFLHSSITDIYSMAFSIGGDPGSTADGKPIVSRSTFRRVPGYAIYKSGTSTIWAPYLDRGCDSDGGTAGGCGNGGMVSNLVNANPGAGSPEDNCNGSGKEHCGEGADPVSLAIGSFDYSHSDLQLTSKGAPLEFTRTYNSSDSSDAGLGPGWSHAGLIRVTEEESGDVLVRRPDGRGDLYTKDGSSYDPPSGVHDTLVKQGDGTFKLTTPDGTVYHFDASARIASITDAHGLTTTYGYNSSGRLQTITDPSSQTLTFSYNASNHITGVADSTGRSVSYTYSGTGDLATVTDALGGITHYGYDGQHRLTTITDPRGFTFLTNVYDGQGRVTDQTDGDGNHWTLNYASGQTTVIEPEGGTRTYNFDSQDRLTSETDELGNTTTRHYDSSGNVDQIQEPGGADWSFSHDGSGNVTSITDPMGGERSYTYDSANHPTSYTDARDNTWDYTWTSNNLTGVTDPESHETDLTYNGAGQPLTVTDANGHTTTNTYDTHGNLTSVADPLGHTTSFGYNTRNYLTSKTEPGHSAEAYTRNALGDLLSVTTPAGNTTSYSYDANGAPTGKTDPASNAWSITRDNMEHPTTYTDPLGHSTQVAYDGNLNPISVTDRRGNTTSYSYDAANRLTGVERPAGDTWDFGYDARGNRTSATDPRAHTSTYQYDLLNRMTEADEPLSTATTYGHDANGNLTSLTDPNGNETTFDYDALNRRTAMHQPLGIDTGYEYDAGGNLTSLSRGVGTLDYSYDDANRLTGITDGNATLRSFTYDASNRLTGATDAQGKTIALGYNGDDLLTSIDDGRGQTVSRGYDSRGNLTSQTDGRGSLTFGYDAIDRMTSLTDPQSNNLTFSYNNEGALTESDLPNGVVSTNAYDTDGRLAETSAVNGATTLQHFAYAYDPAGNRTSQVDRNNDATTYSYDALNRLSEFNPPGGPAVDYAYDAAGNRTQAGSETFSYNALNQLTGSSDGTAYTYDDAGRLTQTNGGGATTTYSWNPLDGLTGVDDASNPVTYSYDALGRRSERTDGSSTTTLHYGDLTDRAILKTDPSSGVISSYVQGPMQLVEQRDDSGTAYPLADGHGDVTTVADASGAVRSRESYDPWGNQLSGPQLENGFLGTYQRLTDPSTGSAQMGARPYNPSLGRFLSEDPVLGVEGVGQSVDRYLYVWDNPINRFDLNGLLSLPSVSLPSISPPSISLPSVSLPSISLPSISLPSINVCTPTVGLQLCGGTSGIQGCVDVPFVVNSCVGPGDAVSAAGDAFAGLGRAISDFWKAIGPYGQSCAEEAVPGAATGAAVGAAAEGVGALPGAAAGGVAGCAEGLESQVLEDVLGSDYGNASRITNLLMHLQELLRG
jgi:RHS repeat-associated protein